MAVTHTDIVGLLLIDFPRVEDKRGFFRQTYQAGELEEALKRPFRVRQGNHSRSQAAVLRGFHQEPWDKLVYVARGTAFCAVADVRPESSTFGRVATFVLGDAPGAFSRIFVSEGLANAFLCLSDVDYINDVSEEFDPTNRRGFIWNDPALAVPWPIPNPLLSDADERLPTLASAFPQFRKRPASG